MRPIPHTSAILFGAFALLVSLPSVGALADPVATPAAPESAPSPVEKLDRVTQEQVDADKAAAASQQRIDNLDDETQKLLAEYRRAVADTESHEAYAAQLTRQIQSQGEELADIQRQLDEVESTSRAIAPLETKMLATLHQFVDLDIPFLLEERKARIATLEGMMDRADVSISEKYRRILEAYQIELDYGRTIEAYDGKLGADQGARTARFLRIGRVALLYQTLDERETGYWDATAHRWVVDNHYSHSFKQGLAVARKTSAPEMLLVPVPAPGDAPASAPTEARS